MFIHNCRAVALLAIGAATATAQVSVQGNPISVQVSSAGATYVGVMMLHNGTSDPQEAKLYQTDYSAAADGTRNYGEPGSSARSNARWISLSTTRIIVPPNQTMNVPYTVTVPTGQPLSGSYWSMVMIEGVPRGSPESGQPASAPKKGEIGIITKIRYAVQIVTDVRAGATRDAKFESPATFVDADSTRILQFDLKNTGTLAFIPTFTLELYSEDGTHVKTLTAQREMTYPANSIRHKFGLGRLPAGSYRAIVTVDTGEDAVFGAQYILKM
jgi:hypothetical protein